MRNLYRWKKGVLIFELFRSCEFFNVKRDNFCNKKNLDFIPPIFKVTVLLWQKCVYISMTKIIKTWWLRWLGTYYGQYHREHGSTWIREKITLLLPGNNTATRPFEKKVFNEKKNAELCSGKVQKQLWHILIINSGFQKILLQTVVICLLK